MLSIDNITNIIIALIGISPVVWNYLRKSQSINDDYTLYVRLRKTFEEKCSCYSLVLVQSFIQKNLSIDEVKWIIYTPGAFNYVREFNLLPCSYISIDIKNNKFKLSRWVDNKIKRFFLRLFIVIFLTILWLGCVAYYIDIATNQPDKVKVIILGIIFVTSLFWVVATDKIQGKVGRAVKLSKVKFEASEAQDGGEL
ncbi:hypothetical protein [Photobacterium damselae]|uniref:hypothetical protein n=1 Tax=Photobacterium damselae TaxID=38293 RepID=UPI001F1D5FB5|nr:hypothetical protein [Photobacterium damselae]UKA04009.1 hypothetical protein IHC89_15895 [Photobacterium damselae subsp. damselae]